MIEREDFVTRSSLLEGSFGRRLAAQIVSATFIVDRHYVVGLVCIAQKPHRFTRTREHF
jgi:hypothetical protein